jgi:hypothetical protein
MRVDDAAWWRCPHGTGSAAAELTPAICTIRRRRTARGVVMPLSFLEGGTVLFLLWLIAVILVISGIVAAVRGAVLYGVLLIILGLLIGPGGVSIFT